MNWHAVTEDEVFRELDSSPSGLSSEQAEERIQKYGTNELKEDKGLSPYRIFIRQFRDILIIILLIAIVLSAAVGELFDAGLIFIIVIFSAILGFIQEYRAEKAVEELKKILSPTAKVLRDGDEKDLPSKELVPGDVIIIEAGDRVPADARLFRKNSIKVDEASLTGESVPVEKSPEKLPEKTELADRNNMLYSGTEVIYGKSRAVVVSTGMETELGKIAGEVSTIEEATTPLEKRTAEIGKWFGIIALGICSVVAAAGIIRESIADGLDMSFALSITMFAIALAVAAVPEALAGIVTGTLAIGMREMAKRNAIIRKMPAVETLGSVTVICSDKTGTITKGEMTVRKIFSQGQYSEVTGTGYAPEGELKVQGGSEKIANLIRAGILCNEASHVKENGKWKVNGDPTEGSLLVLAVKAGFDPGEFREKHPRENEIPFSSERKMMTTVNTTEEGIVTAFAKGAPEVIVEKCTREESVEQKEPLSDKRKEELKRIAESMANEGLRVLAFAMKELEDPSASGDEIENSMVFLGFAGMIDPARTEAIEAVEACYKMGIKPVMITGDHKLTAKAVASEVGIFKEGERVLTGSDLDDLTDEEYMDIVAEVTVYARVSPMHKLRIIKAWKEKGQIVAMTGDGVNDAPAIKKSDIGIAMGITGTDVSKEASDMILADDNFATIIKAVERGRWIYDNIKKYLTYLIEANLVEVAILGGITIIMGTDFLPLLPAAILFINLVTDGLPAIALGVSPPDPDIMERPPRDPDESVFTTDVKVPILIAFFVYVPVFSWIFFRSEDLEAARTSLFFLFALIELVIALNLRSLSYSLFQAPPHRWLVLSVIFTIALTFAVVLFQPVRESFGINFPTAGDLRIVFIVGLAVTAIFETAKAVLRKYSANSYKKQ